MKIGILLPIAETDSGTILRYRDMRDATLQAQRDRFDSVWTAELADAWNTSCLGRASELPEKLAPMHAACSDVGRDPAMLEVTVGQIVAVPELTREPDAFDGADRFEFANPETLAEEWRGFEEQGVGHVIVWPRPYDTACLELVTAAPRIDRNGNGQ